MPFYMFQAKYSTESIQAMVSSPHDREAAARPLIEALGGTLHHFFFAMGEYDVVAIIEAPDDESLAAGSLAVGASGSMSGMVTTKLMTSEQGMAAMTKAGTVTGAYKPAS